MDIFSEFKSPMQPMTTTCRCVYVYNSKVDHTSGTSSNLPGHGILLTFISMDSFNNVPSIAMFMTVNMIMHRDMYMIHIYVTQVKYTINDHIIFNIEIVALRGRTPADV